MIRYLLLCATIALNIHAIPVILESAITTTPQTIEVFDYRVQVCGTDCNQWCTTTQCPLNIGSIITKDSKDPHGEYTAVVASTIGKPSIMVASGASVDTMYISPSTISGTANFWVNAIQNVVNEARGTQTGTPFTKSLQLLEFAADATVVGIQVEALFEYTDADKDGKFTPGVDTVLQVYDLDRQWLPTVANITAVIGGDEVGTLTFTTVDGMFSMRIETSNIPDAPPQPASSQGIVQIRHPAGARVVFHAKNFSFQGQLSRLGVKTILLSPENQSSQSGFRKYQRNINIATVNNHVPLGYLSWTPTALMTCTAGPNLNQGIVEEIVQPSDLINANYQTDIAFGIGKSTLINQQSIATVYSEGEAQVLYFSLSGNAYNPSEFYWDFSIGHGSMPRRLQVAPVGNIAVILITVICAFLTCCFAHVFKLSKAIDSSKHEKLLDKDVL